MLISLPNNQSVTLESHSQDVHEEYAIGKAGEGIHLPEAVWKLGGRRPLAHNSGTETNDKSQTVEEHVYAIAKQA